MAIVGDPGVSGNDPAKAAIIAGPGVVATNTDKDVDAESLHKMFVAGVILLAFVMVAVLLAGESQTMGNWMIGLMGLMLVVQGVGHVNPFIGWIAGLNLTNTNKGATS